jgi:hypothetical protein
MRGGIRHCDVARSDIGVNVTLTADDGAPWRLRIPADLVPDVLAGLRGRERAAIENDAASALIGLVGNDIVLARFVGDDLSMRVTLSREDGQLLADVIEGVEI